MTYLLTKYRKEIVGQLQKEFNLKSSMSAPKLEKIIISAGLGQAIENQKIIDIAKENLKQITGQMPIVTKSKQAISGFKLRAGLPLGLKVTLRGQRMYEFLERFLNAALGRIRDFRGVSPKSFDKSGNFNIGIREHNIFPEISTENLEFIHGLQITIVFNTSDAQQNMELLKKLGMPFEKIDK